MKKSYKSFSEFLSAACSRELEYFIYDSKFTSAFNYRMKKLMEEAENKGKGSINFSIIFNTEEEVAIIDAAIIGRYVSNSFITIIESKYKGIAINNIIKKVTIGNEKNKEDFIVVSYNTIHKVMEELYKDIKYNKKVLEEYVKEYKLEEYRNRDLPIVICSLLILEDICGYLKIDKSELIKSLDKIISSKRL
ncbi:hypothetical protein CLHOM_17140 [Clostridium homopropionicum DSM 5847]|uniref:Uncharacterized protein n=2 Tax=Clostridium TaxID=1485 RepID=A0A0L6Z9I2_9CLOT|nr:hypothetical protein CLHOM_17140 [Clostridium homopropionicum DSM 5847]SFF81428.1 hypothetical protein SAMN04488501_102279 [Clostridium homopropionicum]